MPEAKLTLQLPAETWIGDVSRRFPSARFRILAGIPGEGTGVALVELTADDLEAVLEEMRAAETLTSMEILRTYGDQALLQLETTVPLLLLASAQSGQPPAMPFDVVDGSATWELTASRERLSQLADRFDQLGVPLTVDYIRAGTDPAAVLTDRQSALVEAALEAGYYDTPRRCTLTELAEAQGLAKSTLSGTLHRAEGQIIEQFVRGEADGPLT